MKLYTAIYKDITIDADDVDNDIKQGSKLFNRSLFLCESCHSKLEFSRGGDKELPFFRNAKLTEHFDHCCFNNNYNNVIEKHPRLKNHIENITSVILPRAKRIKDLSDLSNFAKREKQIARTFGKQTRSFLFSTVELFTQKELYEDITICTEDGERSKVRELLKRQDEVIYQLNKRQTDFICIIRGYVYSISKTNGGYRINLSQNTTTDKYKNTLPFYLFLPKSYFQKNKLKENDEQSFLELKHKLIKKQVFCYGPARMDPTYGASMTVFFIDRQVYIL